MVLTLKKKIEKLIIGFPVKSKVNKKKWLLPKIEGSTDLIETNHKVGHFRYEFIM